MNPMYAALKSIQPEALTENAWASRAGVNRSWFADVRKGTSPRTQTLERVVAAAGLSLAQFYDVLGGADRPLTASPQLPFRGPSEVMDVPLLGTAQGSDFEVDEDGRVTFVERMDLDTANVIEYLRRPAALHGRNDIYAITVIGNSVAPRYEDGDPAYVESRRQPSPGDYVVVQLRRIEGDDERLHIALLKRLVRKTSTYIELEQTNPEARFTLPLADVHAIHRVKPWREIVFF